jgi:hypothetical protein
VLIIGYSLGGDLAQWNMDFKDYDQDVGNQTMMNQRKWLSSHL